MNKLDNLTAIAQPIPETQAETINGGRSLAEIGRQVSGDAVVSENRTPDQDFVGLKRKRLRKARRIKNKNNR